MSTAERRQVSVEEYLAFERQSETRNEYYAGEIFAMAGASRNHNVISGNVFAEIRSAFADQACEVYQSDMRVKASPSGLYTYPDVVATCASPEFEDDELDTLLNPQVIFEVLSRSTENYDRGEKFELYRGIDSLADYVLIAQDRLHVEHYQRQGDGRWILDDISSDDGTLRFATCRLELNVGSFYAKVKFDE